MSNIPEVKLGIIAVSRDCFPIELSNSRRKAIVAAYGEGLYECPVTVENEKDALKALEDVKAAGVNALVVFLGNFGPETQAAVKDYQQKNNLDVDGIGTARIVRLSEVIVDTWKLITRLNML